MNHEPITMTNERIETDVLIIGCGIAGATAALELAKNGVLCTLITRAQDPRESNTFYAQGGIVYQGEGDCPQLLSEDIIKAGSNINNPKAVKFLSELGPKLVKEILVDRVKVPFSQKKDGLELVLEGGHNMPRIIHQADTTGQAIETQIIKAAAAEPKINILPSHSAVDLLTPGHHGLDKLAIYDPLSCSGAYVFDQETGRVKTILAKKTILATGGLGQIYLYTTNPQGARGDGIAMTQRAGARVINLEYVQFHPTAFYHTQAPRFLITEAARGEGGKLVNTKGEYFMERYDPKWQDLAPRDLVARSIYNEMLQTQSPNVFLDLKSFIVRPKILKHFKNIHETLLGYGVDITKDLVPVVPAAHYSCGGVWVDENGRTTINNLYAAGEVSCTGLHGANRLASTSLLEGLVWGKLAADDILNTLGEPHYNFSKIPNWVYFGSEEPDPALISQDFNNLKQIMWNYVGLVRTAPRLERALRELRHLEGEITKFYHATRITDEILGLRNAVLTGYLVAQAAWENKSSLGCHYRES